MAATTTRRPVTFPWWPGLRATVAAVEAELGGPQEYFEINATSQLVNLFVATDDKSTATAYVYLGGGLYQPAPPRDVAGGETFRCRRRSTSIPMPSSPASPRGFEEPDVTQFVVVGGPNGAVQYSAFVVSSEGGILDVLLGPDGTVLGVNPG